MIPSSQDIKKPQRGEDLHLAERNCWRGKQAHQKLKPYLVLQYLLKESDPEHPQSAFDIIAFLEGECGVNADRRSIYKDIEEINAVALMLEEEDMTFEDALSEIEGDEDDERKLIRYTHKGKKGFYVQQIKYELSDIRLLAECIYASKFISDKDADLLIEVVGDLVSIHQSDSIKHPPILWDNRGAEHSPKGEYHG